MLKESFVRSYKDKIAPFGGDGLGWLTYRRTYSRIKDDGKHEEWYETIARCVNGAQRIGANLTEDEEKELFDLVFNLKGCFAGRSLWMLGTPLADKLAGNGLINCFHRNMDSIESFEFLMDDLMLGSGVGYSIERSVIHDLPKIKSGVSISHSRTNDAGFIVPDSREGWSALLRQVLKSYFVNGKSFTYSTLLIREFGAPLKTFGGTASGAGALIDGITDICKIIDGRIGKKLRSIDVLDICNIIARVVVAGSSRRSATIAQGDTDDFLFLRAKQWNKFNIPAWRSQSNNSIFADSYDQIIDELWNGYNGGGECYGLLNRKLARKIGRIGEPVDDSGVAGFNPCFRGDQLFLTPDGWRRFDEMAGQSTMIVQDLRVKGKSEGGIESWAVNPCDSGSVSSFSPMVMKTGTNKHVIELRFVCGRSLILTDDHEIATTNGMVRADRLTSEHVVLVGMPDPYMIQLEKHVRLGERRGARFPEFARCFDRDTMIGVMRWNARQVYDQSGAVHVCYGDSIRARAWVLSLQRLGIFAEIDRETGDAVIRDVPSIYLYQHLIGGYDREWQFYTGIQSTTRLDSIKDAGYCDVYCLKEDVRRTVIVNGITVRRCAEVGLEDGESCNLAEIFLPRVKSKQELFRVSELLYKVQKSITNLNFLHKITNETVRRNRRLGQGVTGILQSRPEQVAWLDDAYRNLRAVDRDWSKKMGIPESIKLTCQKPSGSVSLLPFVTPGIHPAYSKHFIRRIRLGSIDPLADICRASGYPVKYDIGLDGKENHNFLVVEMPCQMREAITAAEVTAVDQLDWVRKMQTVWADNAVSCTVYYKKEELSGIREWLSENYENSIKSVSFLLHSDHGFAMAPYEEIDEETYHRLRSKIKPLNTGAEVGEGDLGGECEGGACPIK